MTAADPAPFLRGNRFPAGAGVTYPRADPVDAPPMGRLPADTWTAASLPVTVRLELEGDAPAVDVRYRTETEDFGYRGPAAGTSFAVWRSGTVVDEQKATLGEGSVRLALGTGAERVVVYLPEGMRPTILELRATGGTIEPAAEQPRWTAYGDSIAEGWIASGPAGAWPAVASRRFGLDVANLGYAGAARGEIPSAEHVASLAADVISITHGTNCWTRLAHSVAMMRANLIAFLDIVRTAHPDTPVVLASPVVRPDAEAATNKLGATLADLRAVMEEVGQQRIDAGDAKLTLVRGGSVITAEHLADGIHPGDEGHQILAEVFGGAVAAALEG